MKTSAAPGARDTPTSIERDGDGGIPSGALTPGLHYTLDGRRLKYHGRGVLCWFERDDGKLYDVSPEFVGELLVSGQLKPAS